jgi:nucleotide-binding universal stress UspA family protein
MKIMVSIDGSEHSQIALAEAWLMSWPEPSEITLVSVVDNIGPLAAPQKFSDVAKDLLEKSAARARENSGGAVQVKTELLRGNPKSEILKFAERWKPDLLMMGSRGRKGLHRVLLGSVSHALLLASQCSVHIARKRKGDVTAPRKVILCLDLSEDSDVVRKEVAARRWRPGTEFICVTAVPSTAELMNENLNNFYSVGELEKARDQQIESAKRSLNKTAKLLGHQIPDVKTSFEIIDGDPREAIVEKADQWEVGLIMTGCKGKQLLDRLVIGSVSEAIATYANCSVEVVK